MRVSYLGFAAVAAVAAVLPPGIAVAVAEGPRLAFPLACQIGRDCEVQHYVDRDPGPGVLDYRCGHRTYQGHNGVDIRLLDMAQQRRGVDVLAAAAGRVARLRDGEPDISIRDRGAPDVKGRECGNGVVVDHGDGWETQYCHLARGSIRVSVGETVKAGDPLGRVGLSGDTEFPHLHITVRHAGQVVDPFAPSQPLNSCAAGAALAESMWTASAQKALGYKAGEILNAGLAGEQVSMSQVETGGIAPPTVGSSAVVVYLRAIELAQGDVLALTVRAPDGTVLVSAQRPPLEREEAEAFALAGRKRPPSGWPKGRYVGIVQVIRGGKPVMARQVAVVF